MAVVLGSCKPGTPKQFIQPDDMEDILVDYHLAKAMAQQGVDRPYNEHLLMEAVLKKHGVTEADFDSSLVYYYTRADRFDGIYKRVANRLEEQAVALGASEGEIGKYATLNNEGDTANIWVESPTLMLMPVPPYNRYEFTIEADSTFQKGDQFLFQFMADYVYQDGSKDGILYLAVSYPDTVVTRQQRFSYSGLSQLRFNYGTQETPQRIKGYFYLDNKNQQTTTTLRLLFVNSIQLVRFHQHQDEPKTDELAKDSIAPGADARGLKPDTARSGDRSGDSAKVLPTQGRAGLLRVADRSDTAKAQPARPGRGLLQR